MTQEIHRYPLPDGRQLNARVVEAGTKQDPLGPLWELSIGDQTLVGRPLNSALAELLGWKVAHEDWPLWVDELAAQIMDR